MDFLVSEKFDGWSVLDVMRREMGMSHAMVKHLKFKQGGITLNGEHVTVRGTVHTGDMLRFDAEDKVTPDKLTPSNIPLRIAYEDDDVVVPDKSADMPTHQSFGHYGDTVANALAHRYTSLGIPYVFRPVNRLDRNTSGLLLIARNRLCASYLSEQMKDGNIKKAYVAVLRGKLESKSGTIDTYMRRTAQSIIVREVCDEHGGGDRAITEYCVLCESDTHTLVRATPITGRTHQLRVHFSHLGCPIEGDDLYGAPSELIGRHALHSFMLSFPCRDGREITVSAPMHEDMRALCDKVLGDALSTLDPRTRKLILSSDEVQNDEI